MFIVKNKQTFHILWDKLKRIKRRRYIKSVITVLVLAVLIGATVMETGAVYTILVNGREVGFVKNKEELGVLMDSVSEQMDEILQDESPDLETLETVTVKKRLSTDARAADSATEEAILESVDGIKKLCTVYVDGVAAGAVENEEDAMDVISEIKENFSVPSSDVVEFSEDVSLVKQCVNEKELYMTPEELAETLDPENADSPFCLTVISKKNEEFERVVDYDIITIEDETEYEGNSEVTTEGKEGLSKITAIEVFENRENVEEIVLDEEVIQQPVNREVTVGTAERPLTASYGEYIWPTTGHLTSYFGYREGGIGSTYHQGIDICGEYAQDILAADGGEVILAEWYGGYGNYIQIRHDDGTVTAYGHCSEFYVSAGDKVCRGQPIAAMGDTGTASAEHLHFEIIVNGERTDPLPYLP